MGLWIYNSLTGQKEEFQPLNPPEVKMYVCGPTVYDEPHIGHLRSAYVFEVMRRWLEHAGYKVKFVRNVTDVDDKIIEKARQDGASDLISAASAVSSKYLELYKQDLKALGISEPSSEPRATQYIQQMQDLIANLIQKGFAYHVPGSSDVFYEVKKFGSYAKLSKQNIDAMMDQARKEYVAGKRDPLDFALWKGAKPGEPSWPSPWGCGRPGWHIECSAMNLACLGEEIDIHGGGLDLKFPHHENEIAQSEAATGKLFAKYWVHHGLVTVDAQKMSKSLKNYVTLQDVIQRRYEKYGIRALRVLFLSTHYSSALDFSEKAMKEAFSQYERILNFMRDCSKHDGASVNSNWIEIWSAKFAEAMNDDFNTPRALSVLHELIDATRKNGQSSDYFSAKTILEKNKEIFVGLIEILEAQIKLEPNDQKKADYIKARLEVRKSARKEKDFALSDQIRKELLGQGVEIRDLPDGTTEWWVKI